MFKLAEVVHECVHKRPDIFIARLVATYGCQVETKCLENAILGKPLVFFLIIYFMLNIIIDFFSC